MISNNRINSKKIQLLALAFMTVSPLMARTKVVVFSEKEILESTVQGQGTLKDINKYEDNIIAIIEQERMRISESEEEIFQLQREYDERIAHIKSGAAVLTDAQQKALTEEAHALKFAQSELAVLQEQFYRNAALAKERIDERYAAATSQFYKKVFHKYASLYGWDIVVSKNSSDMVLFARDAADVTSIILKNLKKQSEIQSKKFETIAEVKALFADLGLVYLDENKKPSNLLQEIERSAQAYYQEHTAAMDNIIKMYGQAVAQKRRAPIYVAWVSDQVGWGVFAAQDIGDGEFIQEYTGVFAARTPGVPFDSTYAWQLYQPENSRLLLIDSKIEGNEMRFVNHSNHPNLMAKIFIGLDKQYHVTYIAKGLIKAGEQLLVSYGAEYWKDRGYFQELFD